MKSCILKKLGGLRALGESKRHYYMTMGQYDPELIIRPDKVQHWAKTVYLRSNEKYELNFIHIGQMAIPGANLGNIVWK